MEYSIQLLIVLYVNKMFLIIFIDLSDYAKIYLTLTSTMEPVFAYNSMGLYSEIKHMKNLSRI